MKEITRCCLAVCTVTLGGLCGGSTILKLRKQLKIQKIRCSQWKQTKQTPKTNEQTTSKRRRHPLNCVRHTLQNDTAKFCKWKRLHIAEELSLATGLSRLIVMLLRENAVCDWTRRVLFPSRYCCVRGLLKCFIGLRADPHWIRSGKMFRACSAMQEKSGQGGCSCWSRDIHTLRKEVADQREHLLAQAVDSYGMWKTDVDMKNIKIFVELYRSTWRVFTSGCSELLFGLRM